jgi:hypothetical protein
MRYVSFVIVLLGGLAVASCRSGAARSAGSAQGSATLEVRNQSFSDMRIYAIRSGTERVRLGVVNGNSTGTLVIPGYLIAGLPSIRFLADPIGGNRTPVSEEISVRPGDLVQLTIPPP